MLLRFRDMLSLAESTMAISGTLRDQNRMERSYVLKCLSWRIADWLSLSIGQKEGRLAGSERGSQSTVCGRHELTLQGPGCSWATQTTSVSSSEPQQCMNNGGWVRNCLVLPIQKLSPQDSER